MELIDYCLDHPIEDVLNLPDVKVSEMEHLEPYVKSVLEELRFHRPEKNEG